MAGIAKTSELFDLSKTLAAPLLSGTEYAWEALPEIKEFIIALGKSLPSDIYTEVSENVWIAKSAKVFPSAYIDGPTIICEDAEIRHCAFIRGSVIVGKGSIVGNSCEVKNSIICDGVEVGCNSVLCPGTVIGKNSTIYPLTRVRGFVPERSIHKGDVIVEKI